MTRTMKNWGILRLGVRRLKIRGGIEGRGCDEWVEECVRPGLSRHFIDPGYPSPTVFYTTICLSL